MTSINPAVCALHQSYIESMGMDAEDLPMNMVFERWWQMAHLQGLTPDDVKLCVKHRIAFNRKGGFKKGLEVRHFARDEEDVAIVLGEVAVIRASMRVKVMDPARASVLEATGRPATLPETDAKPIGETELLKALRKAAG